MIEKIQYMTQNACYLWNKKNSISIVPTMVIIHSTATRGVMADEWFNRWNNSWTKKGVHAFVDAKQRCVTLPETMWAWGVGGKANGYSLQMEICEDRDWSKEYFRAAIGNAVKIAAEWCIKYKIPVDRVIGHYEAYKMGIGSNHGDPSHWFQKFGYSMDTFRSDVQKEIGKIIAPVEEKIMDRQFTIANLNVRYGPGTNFKILKTAPKGTYLEIYDASGGWAKVNYAGVTGYVSTKYLQDTISGYVTASEGLNVRKTPGGVKVGELKKGTRVKIYYKEGEWYRIGIGKWVSDNYIKTI